MNKRYKILSAILVILMLLLCGCQKQYDPDEVKTIVAENFDLLKEAADLTISKNLSSPISMYELKEVEGLAEEELEVFKKCRKIGVMDLYYSNDVNGNKTDNDCYLLLKFYYEPMCQAILYIPDNSDLETPEEAMLSHYPFTGDVQEITELDENWYYYLCKW